jgi:hypothetical protein
MPLQTTQQATDAPQQRTKEFPALTTDEATPLISQAAGKLTLDDLEMRLLVLACWGPARWRSGGVQATLPCVTSKTPTSNGLALQDQASPGFDNQRGPTMLV